MLTASLRQAFLDYLDYEYLGMDIFGSVSRVNKNLNGKKSFQFWVSNDLVEKL